MTDEVFSLETFFSLGVGQLGEYVEPFLIESAREIPETVYDELAPKLDDLDIAHKVYALELCMRVNPNDFKDKLLICLSDSNAAVCCTAFNLLNKLDVHDLDEDQKSRLQTIKEIPLFSTDVRTGEEIRIGSNRQFIQDLQGKFLKTDCIGHVPPSAT